MGKSQLTKNIEKALITYKPAMLSGFELNYRRKCYIDYEVPVLHAHIEQGLVDCVWLAEGYNNHQVNKYCSAPNYLTRSTTLGRKKACDLSIDELRDVPKDQSYSCNQDCFYCRGNTTKDEAVAVICFEIKISRADFKSKNGHNFIGNLNYYVMPYNLYKQLGDEIPDNIGVITYHYTDVNVIGKLRHTKSCNYQPNLDYALYTSLLHTFLDKQGKRFTKVVKKLDNYKGKIVQHYTNKCSKLLDNLSCDLRSNGNVPKCFQQSEFSRFCINSKGKCNSCIHSYNYLSSNIYCKIEEDFNNLVYDAERGLL